MNQLYFQLLNPQYVNEQYYHQLQQQFAYEQRVEIMKLVKAVRDCIDTMRRISPEFQQEAIKACIMTIVEEMAKDR